MHPAITAQPPPDWLMELGENAVRSPDQPLPLQQLLTDSCYYPASGRDGRPVQWLAGLVHSFVFADYAVRYDEFSNDIQGVGFAGYRIFAERKLERSDVVPIAWTPPLRPTPADGRLSRLEKMEQRCEPFGHWSVWERLPAYDATHGPARFSLLFFAGEGCAAFQGLYARTQVQPRVLAIVQPGTGFGGNWTDFRKEDGFLARCMKLVPQFPPPFLLYGGWGRSGYEQPCWSSYTEELFAVRGSTCARLWALDAKVATMAREQQPDGPQSMASGSRTMQELVEAYRRTTFDAATPQGTVEIRPEQVSEDLEQFLDAGGLETWAHVTAYNPRSVRLTDDENARRHDDLRRALEVLGFAHYPGTGRGDDGWTEPGFLVLGISREDAAQLGEEFDQNAIVFGVRSKPAEIVVLAP